MRQGVGSLEVLVGGGEFLHMLEPATVERVLHVFDDHLVQMNHAFGRSQQGLTHFCRDCHRKVFMLGYRLDFAAVEIAIIKYVLH